MFSRVATILVLVLLIGIVGTGLELLLLGHTEGFWQKVPLGLLGTALVATAWQGLVPGRTSLRVFVVMMILLVASGLAGLLLHYKGNVEFELETRPGLAGWELFWAALRGATPSLAPGAMTQLGLIGLVYGYLAREKARRHVEA
jgi:hypothetical protein